MRAFEKATKNRLRGLQEGQIHIYVNKWVALLSTLLLVIGGVTRGIADSYSNASRNYADQGCPALGGQIHQWVVAMGNGIILVTLKDDISIKKLICFRIHRVCISWLFNLRLATKVIPFLQYAG